MTKRFLLTLISVFALSASFLTNAEEIDFGYCGPIKEPFYGAGNSVGSVYGAAMEIPESTAGTYKGCNISAISVGFGTAQNCEVELFISTDLSRTPVYTQTATLKPATFTTVPLTTPFPITGEKIFVGYKFESSAVSDAPMAFDRDEKILSPYGHWVSQPFYPDMFDEMWEQYYPAYGNVCIRTIISGEIEQVYSVIPESVSIPRLVRPDKEFTANLTVSNLSPSAINDIEILWKAGSETGTCSYTFATPLKTGAKEVVPVIMKSSDDNEELPLSFSIAEVNGKENTLSATEINETILCSIDYALRNVLVEKNTGTLCGYCPMGIVGFDMMEEEVTDGSFIPVEVHNYSYGTDPMVCPSYVPWNEAFCGYSAPSSTINRQNKSEYPSYAVLKSRYDKLHDEVTDIDISLETAQTGNNIEATAKVRFSKERSGIDYGIGFILTEDGIGPYYQYNNYAGQNGTLPGWNEKGSPVSTMYNNVARQIFDWDGASGSVPANVAAGETISWSKTLSLMTCNNYDKVAVTAFIVDRNTKEILNAVRTGKKSTGVGIDEAAVAAQKPVVKCHDGILSVDGDYTRAYVYTPDGTLLTTILPGQQRTVANGILIIRFEGGKADGSVIKTVVR